MFKALNKKCISFVIFGTFGTGMLPSIQQHFASTKWVPVETTNGTKVPLHEEKLALGSTLVLCNSIASVSLYFAFDFCNIMTKTRNDCKLPYYSL